MGAKELNPQFEDLKQHETLTKHMEEIQEAPESKLLKELRISPTDELKAPQAAWEQIKDNSIVLGTLGNFSLIIGKAKSRKSFFINIVASALLSEDVILNQFKGTLPPNQRKVLYFDTEQGKYHVQLALKRICDHIKIKLPNNIEMYGLRSLKPSERLKLIEYSIYNTPELGFVIIDGVKDLINSINDETEATMISSKLLKWTEEKNIHITTVLHQNKSDNNARGHIGTELINKAETVLSVTKNDADKNISVVEAQQCRNREPETFAFEINNKGLPEIPEDFEIRTETKRNKLDVSDLDESQKNTILNEVFSQDSSFGYSELTRQIKLAYKKLFNKKLGTNRAKELITLFKNEKYLLQEKERGPYSWEPHKGLDDDRVPF